jgi:hypothetical protein
MIQSVLRIFKLLSIAVAFVATLLGGMMGWFWIQDWQNDRFKAQFAYLDSAKEEFSDIAFRASFDLDVETAEVDLAGILQSPKMVAMTVSSGAKDTYLARHEREFDPLMRSLYSLWVPSSPEEVNLIVAARWRHEAVGSYSDGSRAYQEVCDFEVVDRQSRATILRGTAVGGPPPSRKGEHDKDQYGSGADQQVIDLIKQGLADLAKN